MNSRSTSSSRSSSARLRTARSLHAGEWRLLLRAWWLLLSAEIALRTSPFERVMRRLPEPAPSPPPRDPEAEREAVRRTRRLVGIAARYHLFPMRCLRRSLVVHRLLAEQGIATEFKLGVKKDGDRFAAHAWLEHRGRPIGEAESVRESFTALPLSGSE